MRKAVAVVVAVLALAACGDSGTKTASGASGGTPGGSFCDKLKAYDTQFKGKSPSIDEIIAVYADLAASAPAEIKADVEGLRTYAADQKSSTASSSLTSEAQSEEESSASAAEAASERFGDYAKSKCGIDLSSDESTTQSKFSAVASSISN